MKAAALRWVEKVRADGAIKRRPRDVVGIVSLGEDRLSGLLWRKAITFSDGSEAIVSEGNGYVFVDWHGLKNDKHGPERWNRRRESASCERSIPVPDWLLQQEAA